MSRTHVDVDGKRLIDLNSEPTNGDEYVISIADGGAFLLEPLCNNIQDTGDVPSMHNSPPKAALGNSNAATSVQQAINVSRQGQSRPATTTASMTLSESAGFSVPTAPTASGGVDVEDGVEVLSTPQEPFIGMTFNSWERAKDYYNSYARYAGFSTRIDTSKDSQRDHEKRKLVLVCYKPGVNKKPKASTEGPINPKKLVKERRRDCIERTHCPARMVVRRTGENLWEVVNFEGTHNHELIKKFSITKYLNSHRDIPPEEKKFIKLLHGCTIKTTRAYQIISELYGGAANVPYTEIDAKNLRKEFHNEYKGKDMKATLEYFEEIRKDDPDFYYDFTLDDEDRVVNLFWVDGAARKSYELYGDCVSFDTTYLTNKYNMPCAPFIGINRHGQSIQLGCGFMRDEKTESFVWLFSQFKKAMGDKDPVNIITDQDLAMAAAIEIVFIDSVHRNCRWHIMENARKRLGPFLKSNAGLASDFDDCIDNSFTPAEFERKWKAMLDRHGLHDDERFQHLYDMRDRWVPAFFMDRFFPFLQTTARSEGFNAVLKTYVCPGNSIFNFVQQYRKIQQRIFSKENSNEAQTIINNRSYLTGHPMERQMSTIYTRNLYYVFQQELQYMSSYYTKPILDGELFEVVPYSRCPDKLYGSRTFVVSANSSEGIYSCNCCKFTRDGVLCCHILRVLDILGVRAIPDRYILPRWSNEEEIDTEGEQVPNEPLERPKISELGKHAVRYTRVMNSFAKITRPCINSDEEYNIILKHVEAMQLELVAVRKRKEQAATSGTETGAGDVGQSTSSTQQNHRVKKSRKKVHKESTNINASAAGPTGDVTQQSEVVGVSVKDPPTTKKQGRPREKRYKSGVRMQAPKINPCSYCTSEEHGTKDCPSRPSRTTILRQ
ncbi:hypothetical protein ACP70R_026785 [Stipagrostis hirtigluma subsp. patula]